MRVIKNPNPQKNLSKNRVEENCYSAPQEVSMESRSYLLPSNIYTNNTFNNEIINKKDKSFLEPRSKESETDELKQQDNDPNPNKLKEIIKPNSIQSQNIDTSLLNQQTITDPQPPKELQSNNYQQFQSTNSQLTNLSSPQPNQLLSLKSLNRQIFGFGVILLNEAGYDSKHARQIIGKWFKTNTPSSVLNHIKQSMIDKVIDPVAYITKQLQKETEHYKQKKQQEQELKNRQREQQIQQKYNERREQLEQHYQRTHNGYSNITTNKIESFLPPVLKSLMDKLNQLHKWREDGKPIFDEELLQQLTEEERQLLVEDGVIVDTKTTTTNETPNNNSVIKNNASNSLIPNNNTISNTPKNNNNLLTTATHTTSAIPIPIPTTDSNSKGGQ